MSADEREPACINVIDRQTQASWDQATPAEIEALDTCNICFAGDYAVSDLCNDDLLVARRDGEKIHRCKSTGDPDYDAAYSYDSSATKRTLLEMDPSDVPALSGGEI